MEPRQQRDIFFFSTRSDRLWDPPIQWVPTPLPKVKRPGREVGHPSSHSAEVKNERSYTSTPPEGLIAWSGKTLPFLYDPTRFMEYAMAQLVEALHYKPEGRGLDGVLKIFHGHNPSDRTMALGSTQPLTKMSKSKR